MGAGYVKVGYNMPFLSQARKEWQRLRERAAPDEVTMRICTEKLYNALGRDYVEAHRANAWELLGDPEWFDCHMVRIRDVAESGGIIGHVVFEQEQGKQRTEDPVMRAVGKCPDCKGPAVLEPPFESRGELWETLNYGVPHEHVCATKRTVPPADVED